MATKIRLRPKPGEGPIVWILGAGFSKGLGGPLITDLLSPESLERLESTPGFKELFRSPLLRLAHWFYNFGTRYARGAVMGGRNGQHLWENAEDFLDVLDRAARDGPTSGRWCHLRRLIDSHLPQSVPSLSIQSPKLITDLRNEAVRLLAAECAHFLVDSRTDDEVWKPYRRWREGLLRPGDTVLTFNYDLVLEGLGLSPLLPGTGLNPEGVQVLKLHGSLDWERLDQGSKFGRISGSETEFVCSAPADRIGIATPGPNKAVHTQQLGDLWQRARKALEQAHAIVIVGYSFPKTDSEARTWLVDAIASNGQEYLAVHVVLGAPRTETVDRVMELMRLTLRRGGRRLFDGEREGDHPWHYRTGTVKRPPLYGEDLFSAADRLGLCLPYLQPSHEA